MRMSSDDTPDAVLTDRSAAGQKPGRRGKPQGGPEGTRAQQAGPERKCIVSGVHGERAGLIRLALGPDGAVWPDLGARLPGRGAWIAPDRAMLEKAMAKGKLKGALARAFAAPVTIPDDLPQKIADGLERRALDRLGLELRAGHLIFGSQKLIEWARAGRLHLLLHAGDATGNGVQKLNQAWRVGQAALLEAGEDDTDDEIETEDEQDDAEAETADGQTLPAQAMEVQSGEMQAGEMRAGGDDMAGVCVLPTGREPLSRALGRENVVHSGVTDGKAAARVATDVSRWIAYSGVAEPGSADFVSAAQRLADPAVATTGSDNVMNDGGALPDRRNDEGRA